jgi:hypothetical protein
MIKLLSVALFWSAGIAAAILLTKGSTALKPHQYGDTKNYLKGDTCRAINFIFACVPTETTSMIHPLEKPGVDKPRFHADRESSSARSACKITRRFFSVKYNSIIAIVPEGRLSPYNHSVNVIYRAI